MHNDVDRKILGSKPKWFTWKKKFLLVILIIIGGFGYFKYGTIRDIDVTIAQADSKDGWFLILTDQGAFKNVDSYWHFKTKSADIQGKAIPGSTVTITIYGYRNGMISAMPNVLKITKGTE